MSEYQVIARKWRPQCFADVVGQQHVVRTLRNAISSGRTAHAYLFVGPRGVGKTTLARIFAKALNCEHPKDGEPCGECSSCRAICSERSLDVLEVDAASRNSTNDMRELADDVLTRPTGGRYKIYIIDEVHMLSKAAWNVLLKTVEEPPSHVKFIFATTEVHQVLPTIISRCQRFDLLPIPTRLIAERLQLIADTEKVGITQEAITAIARASEGGMRDAQSLLDQMIAFFAQNNGADITGEQVLSLFGLTEHRDLEALLGALLGNRPDLIVGVIGKLSKKGKNLETLFDDLLAMVRAVHLCRILRDPGELLDEGPEAVEEYRRLAGNASPETLQILLENLAPVGRVLHDALNKQVYLETVLLKAMREAHAVRISDILARLNQLRTAGELKFLDQLPRAERMEIPVYTAPPAPAPEPERKPEPEPQTPPPAPAPEVKPEPVPPAPVPEVKPEPVPPAPVPEVKTEPEPPAIEAVPEPTPAPEPVPEVAPAPEPEVAPVEAVAETAPAPAPVPAPEPESAVSCDVAMPESDGEISDAPLPEPTPEELLAQTKAADNAKLHPEESSTRRVSIANSHPEALREAAHNPFVAEVLDLFSGTVIDVHRETDVSQKP